MMENCESETITNYFTMLPLQLAFFRHANRRTIDMITTEENLVKCDLRKQCEDSLIEKEPAIVFQQKLHAHTSTISSEEFYMFNRAPRDYRPCLSDKNMMPVGTDIKDLLWLRIDFQ